ncbi:uncharacterized protein LOC110708826 isoform X3 [Chenopodium quinoa]|uniref:uncharacterized protein LOC110708826 isoform X3 n=1 Tax=Chenopodium quinoa TaxID=63459 RepID=UPI000B7779F7|nr:uncharacterized protein LOC110708826 isoform X3 [Chenopodium quinoa]XP_021742768.1 uncharacterized protein LOC110708826 isoform X3 [Chenopodium quinoa]
MDQNMFSPTRTRMVTGCLLETSHENTKTKHLQLQYKAKQVEHSNVSKMGKKGSWFSASKRVFAHSSKENVANGIEKKNKERARESKIRDGHSFLPFVRDPVALRILRWLKGGTKLQNLSNQRQNFRLHLSKRQNLRLHLSNQRQNLLM